MSGSGMMTGRSALDALLCPASIAIVGASEDFVKINGRPLKFLLDKGYPGKIFPVNPKYATLAGLACHPSVSAIREPVDLAIVAVPAAAVAAAIRDCAAKGVRAAVVFSSGFGEMGEGYLRLALVENEHRLRQAVRQMGRCLSAIGAE